MIPIIFVGIFFIWSSPKNLLFFCVDYKNSGSSFLIWINLINFWVRCERIVIHSSLRFWNIVEIRTKTYIVSHPFSSSNSLRCTSQRSQISTRFLHTNTIWTFKWTVSFKMSYREKFFCELPSLSAVTSALLTHCWCLH